MRKKIVLQLFADAPEGNKPETKPDGEKQTNGSEDEKKYSDKDLDDIINKKFAKWQEKKQKEVDEAKKLADMNATQRAEHERDNLQKELDEYKRKDAITQMTATARNMLKEYNVSISDELLSMFVSDDAETTKAAVDGFAKAFKDEVEKAVKERIKGEPPRRGSGSPQTLTKEQIMQISDPELRQKRMLENRELFNF